MHYEIREIYESICPFQSISEWCFCYFFIRLVIWLLSRFYFLLYECFFMYFVILILAPPMCTHFWAEAQFWFGGWILLIFCLTECCGVTISSASMAGNYWVAASSVDGRAPLHPHRSMAMVPCAPSPYTLPGPLPLLSFRPTVAVGNGLHSLMVAPDGSRFQWRWLWWKAMPSGLTGGYGYMKCWLPSIFSCRAWCRRWEAVTVGSSSLLGGVFPSLKHQKHFKRGLCPSLFCPPLAKLLGAPNGPGFGS